MVPANSDRILRVPPYSGYHCSTTILPVRGCHPLWCIFPDTSRYLLFRSCGPITPALPQQYRFGLFPFRSPLLWESIFLSLPPGTKMFQFPGFARIMRDDSSSHRVSPFGHPRINSCLPIPAAFRSLPRPSSPIEAKASTVRSLFLRLDESCFRINDFSSYSCMPSF